MGGMKNKRLPEPVKCKCGARPIVMRLDMFDEWHVYCVDDPPTHSFTAIGSTRAEAVERWNELNG